MFDPEKRYLSIASHLYYLKTYAWKPIIIQVRSKNRISSIKTKSFLKSTSFFSKESLQLYKYVFYIDSSIRLETNEIKPVIDRLDDLEFITRMIPLQLVCYTHPKMFKWFALNIVDYEDAYTIDANMLLLKRGFVSSFIMKAWVTCALDRHCIAPIGSRLYGCCGCHRFDQDAITLVASYFFLHPFDSLCPYSISDQEFYFYDIRRHDKMKYFTARLK
jgi:hypothetical protein